MKSAYSLFGLIFLAACAGSPEQPNDPVSYVGAINEQLYTQATSLFKPLPALALNQKNEITPAKVALGKVLYYDTRLSNDGNISCNSCHNLETFGVDNKPTSPGDAGMLGDRNSPTVLNAALHFAQFWDGRAADVEEQAGGPVLNPVEMAMHSEESVVSRLQKVPEYEQMFAAAFPGQTNPITYSNMQYAIGAFERTLITPTRWDKFLEGDKKALNKEEIAGLETFIDAGCITCHTGANLGGHMYQKFGLFHPYWENTGSEKIDEGRYTVTKSESDKYIFKVPGLRNIAETGPYFHDGSIADLGEAIRVMGKLQLDKDLSDEQIKSIITFLNTLTGEVPASALPDKPVGA